MSDQTITIDEEIEEDIPGEIDAFARLNRLGNFKEGSAIYESLLSSHDKLFPVVAEYADLLLEQGSFGKLEDFLENVLDGIQNDIYPFKDEEVVLFNLIKALANLHTSGDLENAINEARQARSKLPKTKPRELSEVEIHILEIYLQIVVFAFQNSSWVSLEDTHPPWTDSTLENRWGGFRKYCKDLNNQGRLWESQKILRLLLLVLEEKDASRLCDDMMDQVDQGDLEEANLIADLSTSNACTQYLLRQATTSSTSADLSKVEEWQSKASSIGEKIQNTGSEEARGRPFFELKMVEVEIQKVSEPEKALDFSIVYREMAKAAAAVDDLSVQVDSLWNLHKLNLKVSAPTDEEFAKLQQLQVDKMRDSVGYVQQIDRSLKTYLEQNREKGTELPIPKAYLEPLPVRTESFNTPKILRQHFENRIHVAEVKNDSEQLTGAKADLESHEKKSSAKTIKQLPAVTQQPPITQPPIVSHLQERPAEIRQARSFIPLHWAVEINDINGVRQHLSNGEDVNERARDGSTALHHAVFRCRSLALTTLLLEEGANPNLQRTTDGYVPLHELVSTSYRRDEDAEAILDRFLAFHADIDIRTNTNGSILGLAACQNLAKPIKRLIENGADPNSPFNGTRSALNIASWHAHVETMKVLIDAGADVNNNASGQTPLLEVVCSQGHLRNMDLHIQGAKMLINAGADLNARTGTATVLSRAVYNGNLGLVKMLVEQKGADPRERVLEAKDLLTHAREQNHVQIAEYLSSIGVTSTN